MLRFFYPKEAEDLVPIVYRKKIPILVYMNIMLVFYFLTASYFRFRSDPNGTLVFFLAVVATSLANLISLALIKFRHFKSASFISSTCVLLNSSWTGLLLPIDNAGDIYRLAMYVIASIIANSMVAIHKRQILIYSFLSMGVYTFVVLTNYTSSLGGFEGDLRRNFIVTILLMAACNYIVSLVDRLNKQLIGDIQAYSDHLEDMVATRTQELATANEQLTKRQMEIERNLRLAQRIQHNILPSEHSYPQRKEMIFGSRYESLDTIGGDFFDIIRMGRNSYGFLIADVSGHGVPAALVTTMAKVSFNANSSFGSSPSNVCALVNQDLIKLLGEEMSHYLTAFFGVLDLETGLFRYTNAGHHAAVLFNSTNKEIKRLGHHGPFLGFSHDAEFTSEEVALARGDKLLLFTDGIVEARNDSGDLYDYSRFLAFVETHRSLPAKAFVDSLLEDVQTFCNGAAPDDDRALLIVHFLGDMEVIVEEAMTLKPAKDEWKDALKEAVNLARSGKLDEAEKLMDDLFVQYPDASKIAHVYATLLYKRGNLDKARRVIEVALERNDQDEDLKAMLKTLPKK